jgi:hypothetical protein
MPSLLHAGAARRQRRPGIPQHAVLHMRPQAPRAPSAVLHGPFDAESDALDAATRIERTAHPGDSIELLTDADPRLAGSRDSRAGRAEDLARRLLRRIRKFPDDFDPRAATARRPPGSLFALACMEAPLAARRLSGTLRHAMYRQRTPAPALVGQVLLDVPHEAAMLLLAVRWPAHWFGGRGRAAPDALRPADAETACAVLAHRLRRGRWPARRTRLSRRIPEALYEPL